MIKAALFDLDGTLLNRDASVQKFLLNQYERLNNWLGHIQKKQYISRFTELECRGYVWKDKVYQQVPLCLLSICYRNVGGTKESVNFFRIDYKWIRKVPNG
ncbi:FMN phosphatase YigB (HAD superfamily) [Bacillus sp. SLBN-46]|nr:FMN phosphatase YigB (HAD superfamily) [Bacillus sp. SLBN-46]